MMTPSQEERAYHALLKVKQKFKTWRGLADAINRLTYDRVTPQAVHGWSRSRKVPSARVPLLHRVSDGEVSMADLRPDLYQ